MTKRSVPTLLGAAVVGALLLAPHAFPDSGSTPVPEGPRGRPLPVATAHPEPATGFVRRRAFTGEVRARRDARLGFERAARVVEVLVDEGDAVGIDTPIARLDVAKLDADKARLLASRQEADAVLREMRAGPRASTIDAAREAVADLRAQVDLLERKSERRKQLVDSKTISDEEYDEILSLLTSLRARLRSAEDQLAELEEGTRQERIDAQVARVAQLAAAVARIDLDIRDSTLEAPFAGRVLRRHVDEGTVVTPGQPVFSLVEDGVLEAWVGVPPRIAAGLGDDGAFTLLVGDRTFSARLRSRLPETDRATRTQTVVFRLPAEAATQVVPGQVARLQLDERVESAGFWVPMSSLTRGVRGLWAVFGLEREREEAGVPFRVVRHPVEVLHSDGKRVLVRGTLDPSSEIVAGNTERVAPGQLVTRATNASTPTASDDA